MKKNRPKLSFCIALVFVTVLSLPGAAGAGIINKTVDSKSVIYAAGPGSTATLDGILPVFVDVSEYSGGVVNFTEVTGTVWAGSGWPGVGPDGGTQQGVNISAYNGISGIYHNNRYQFLAGVFTTDSGPGAVAPARLNFQTIGSDFLELSPLLNQSFYIGDGLTGTGIGVLQNFFIPEGATGLYLGFHDAGSFGWPGGASPWYYGDNSGAFNVSLELSAVPVPAAVWLLGTGLVGLIGLRRKLRK